MALEGDLRAILRCQSTACAFFQSAEYAMFKRDALRALYRSEARLPQVLCQPRTLYFHDRPLVMHVSVGGLRVTIRQPWVMLVDQMEEEAHPAASHSKRPKRCHRDDNNNKKNEAGGGAAATPTAEVSQVARAMTRALA